MSFFKNGGAANSNLALTVDVCAFLGLAFASCCALVLNFDPAFLHLDGVSAMSAATGISPSLLLNAIPAVLVAFGLLAVTRRGILSLAIALSLLFALYSANEVKLELLDTPLLPSDFQFMLHLGDSGALLARYLSPVQVGCALLIVFICALLFRFERPWIALGGRRRVALFLAALLVNGTLLSNVRPWSTVYAARVDRFETWSPSESALRNGMIVTLLNYAWRVHTPAGQVDHAAAARILHRYPLPAALPEPGEWPDIIVLQSESLFDPGRLSNIDDGAMLPGLHELMRSHRHGDLWVPAFGGGTIRTEFEVLTGLAMREFPEIEYPYFSLAASGRLPSLASVLGDKGYRTIAMHPNSRDFWNRATAFENLGFDEFDGAEQFADAERVGYYPSDEELVEHMLKRLDESDGPTFLFAISIENHGPYDNYPNAEPDRLAAQPVPSGLTEGPAARLRGYFYHLENADRALVRLADALQGRARRSLLLFYGDHLPALPKVYAEVGFDDGAPGPLQPVPWLLVDSRQELAVARSEPTASFYLPALLLDAAGIDDRGYFRLLELLRRTDAPKGGWTPQEHEGLRALMRLRQSGRLVMAP